MKIRKIIIEAVIWVIAFAVVNIGLWLFISFLDVITHNIESYRGYGEYASWNLFPIMMRIFN